jgi:lysophospholipase L1-like esterase
MPAKLVAIGDSLTQGFQSGSIFKTHISYPAMIAGCLGENHFKVPDFTGENGLPANLEALFRLLADRYGETVDLLEVPGAFLSVTRFLDRVEDYWERGLGNAPSDTGPLHHNLAVWGFQLGDCDTLTEGVCRRAMPKPKDDLLNQIPEFGMYRTARRTLNPSLAAPYDELTQIQAAKHIADTQGGIDNLIFWLGANHCLGTVGQLKIKWSEEADLYRLAHQRDCTLWVPSHFKQLLNRVAAKVEAIGAKRVFVGTVPHVTIPPVSRGIMSSAGQPVNPDGYYDYYTHFWVWDDDFVKNPEQYPYLTRDEARLIDSVIDEYNDAIKAEADKRGWFVIDLCKVLDQLAFRRQQGNPTYEFPQSLIQALRNNPKTRDRFIDGIPILDTRYLYLDAKQTDAAKKYKGGLFSLDGIHPTTIGYGLIAHEAMKIMSPVLASEDEMIQALNWDNVVEADTLVTKLPSNLDSLRNIFAFLSSQKTLNHLIQRISSPS